MKIRKKIGMEGGMASPTPFFFLVRRLCQPVYLDTICHLSSNQTYSLSKLSLQFSKIRQIAKSLCSMENNFMPQALSSEAAISTIMMNFYQSICLCLLFFAYSQLFSDTCESCLNASAVFELLINQSGQVNLDLTSTPYRSKTNPFSTENSQILFKMACFLQATSRL